MANLKWDRRTSLSLSDLGSMPNLPHSPSRNSPIFVVSRFHPKSAPSATTVSTDSVETETELLDVENGPVEIRMDPAEVLGTLRMHYHDVSSWSPSYLQSFFRITNFAGFTPYRFTMHNQRESFGKMKFWVTALMVFIIFIFSLTGALLLVPTVPGDGRTLQWLLEYRFREIENFLVARNLNQTLEIFYRDLEDTLDFKIVIIGSIGCLMNFVGIFGDQLIRYAILLSTLTLKDAVFEFNFEQLPLGLEVGIVSVPNLIGQQIQMHYNELKRISKSLNDVFEGIIELLLLDGLLMLSDFFTVIFSTHLTIISKAFCIFEAFTILIMLFYAVGISKKMTTFRDWLTSECGPEKYGITKDDVSSILQELSTNPVGVGRDSLYTNKGFLVGLTVTIYSKIVGQSCGRLDDNWTPKEKKGARYISSGGGRG
ncbi:unnamed protein product [Orchesella dallaii]|uniref:Uncharacterized protein n=1 Tax=Orchesella dallaii TaxID=48710 RepID=A0ABP1S951_9HEXA